MKYILLKIKEWFDTIIFYERYKLDWIVHKSMVESNSESVLKIKAADLISIIEEDFPGDLYLDRRFPESVFSLSEMKKKPNFTKIHASIVIVNGKGYVLRNWKEYHIFCKYIENTIIPKLILNERVYTTLQAYRLCSDSKQR